MKDVVCQMRAERFSNNRTLDLQAMGNGIGVRGLTIRNVGTVNLIIDDEAREIIRPNERLAIDPLVLVNNRQLRVFFDPNASGQREAVVRYLVDTCD